MDRDALKKQLAEVDFSSCGVEVGLYKPIIHGPRKISEQYPVMDVTDEVAEVIQANFGVTDSNDAKPIIATSALFTCIGLLGYDRGHNLGFLMHFQSSNDVRSGLERLYQELSQTYPNIEKEFDANIVTSTLGDFQIYRDLKEALRGNPSGLRTRLNASYPIEFKLDNNRVGKPCEGIALDTRNGTILAYLRKTLRECPCDFKYSRPIPEKRSFEMGRF